MKKLIVAGAAMLAATLMSGSAFAVPGSDAKGLQASTSAVSVAYGYCHRRHCYGGGGPRVRYVPAYSGCGCGGGGFGLGSGFGTGYGGGCCGGGLFGGLFGGIF